MAEQNKEPEKRTVGYDFIHGGVAGVKYVRRGSTDAGQVYEIVEAGELRDRAYGNEFVGIGVITSLGEDSLNIMSVWSDERATPEEVQRNKHGR